MRRTALPVIVVWMIAAAAIAQHPDAEAALADRARYCPDEADFKYVYYLSTRPYSGEAATDLIRAMRLSIASTSHQPVIERCTPYPVQAGLFRIDLRELGWRFEDWARIVGPKQNPYATADLPLIVRADWLLVQIGDMKQSQAYHQLLYGEHQPKTRDDLLKFYNIGDSPLLTFGMVEGKSKVAKQGTRRIENRPIYRGYAYGTFDVTDLTKEKDPVENLGGGSPHDAEEWIVGIIKISRRTGHRGMLQVYFLVKGVDGTLQNFAPVDIVEDSTEFRGHREIVAPGSCYQCHKTGLNPTTQNAFRAMNEAGVETFADPKTAELLESFHLSDLDKEILRNSDDYQTTVELVCGATGEEVAASYKAAINRYDAPLALLDCAQELYVTVEELTLALARSGANLPIRLASLPHGGTIPRDAWEQHYLTALEACQRQSGLPAKEKQ